MIPIRDHNPTTRQPYVTITLIVICVLVFVWQGTMDPRTGELIVRKFGFIPASLFGPDALSNTNVIIAAISTLFSSMFLHGGFMHLAGNMLYLWIFGNNIEDVLGHVRYLIFYLLCGVIAALVQAVPDMDSTIPMIGASGAISGVLGAYLLLFPNVKVQVVIPIGFFIMRTIPAGWLLGFWIVFQIFSGFAAGVASSGVAWWAHVGGFIAGMALIYLFREKTSDPTATGSVGRSKNSQKADRPSGRSRIPDSRSDATSDRPSSPPTVQRRRDP
ncbi:MAG: rhomboid family intramembrane serine protease [Geminicoccaceae bacterium]